MEKLIVKNFGPIKEAEIDLTKFVVFIGDTSTGKSVLGKLISIFRDLYYDFSIKIKGNNKKLNFTDELKRFNIDFDTSKSEFVFSIDKVILINFKKNEISFKKNHSAEKFAYHIEEFYEKISDFLNIYEKSNSEREKLLEGILDLYNINKKSVYIPAERILYSLVGNSISGLWANNVALPDIYKDFAAKYEIARKNTTNREYYDFGFSYSHENNSDKVTFNDVKLELSKSSSGIQSLIPMLLVIENEIKNSTTNLEKTIIIEEPELNLFPIRQKKVVDFIVKNSNKTSDNFIITTHSPYILSSLDTLMLAKNVFNENPDLKDEISAIVSEDKWLDYKDISVYEVRNDGKVYSIKNEEFKSIDTNAIDSVSDVIMEEFDKLTELRYATH